MSKFKPPNVPFVEAKQKGRKQRPKAIVLRLTYTTSDKGAALGMANTWHRNRSSIFPCHYVVDEAEAYRCVPDRQTAGDTALSAKGVINVGLCAEPVITSTQWMMPQLATTLDKAAQVVAELALAYKIPVVYNASSEAPKKRVKRRQRGITIGLEGGFPAGEFQSMVRAKMAEIRKTSK